MNLLLIGSVSVGVVLGWWALRLMCITGSAWRRGGGAAVALATSGFAAFFSVKAAGMTVVGFALGVGLHGIFIVALRRNASYSAARSITPPRTSMNQIIPQAAEASFN